MTRLLFEDQELVPDERAVDRAFEECPADAELLLAAGSGVSPLIRGGSKQTVPGVPPRALWVDLDVVARAPAAMIAAGVGDLAEKRLA